MQVSRSDPLESWARRIHSSLMWVPTHIKLEYTLSFRDTKIYKSPGRSSKDHASTKKHSVVLGHYRNTSVNRGDAVCTVSIQIACEYCFMLDLSDTEHELGYWAANCLQWPVGAMDLNRAWIRTKYSGIVINVGGRNYNLPIGEYSSILTLFLIGSVAQADHCIRG